MNIIQRAARQIINAAFDIAEPIAKALDVEEITYYMATYIRDVTPPAEQHRKVPPMAYSVRVGGVEVAEPRMPWPWVDHIPGAMSRLWDGSRKRIAAVAYDDGRWVAWPRDSNALGDKGQVPPGPDLLKRAMAAADVSLRKLAAPPAEAVPCSKKGCKAEAGAMCSTRDGKPHDVRVGYGDVSTVLAFGTPVAWLAFIADRGPRITIFFEPPGAR